MSYNLPLLTADGGPSPALATQTLQMIAGGSITAGDVVAFDTSLTGEDRVAPWSCRRHDRHRRQRAGHWLRANFGGRR
jgi:hypothetical protein